MKRQRRKYENPTRPFDKQRIERERELLRNFGLRRKQEIWKSEALLRKYRRFARELAAQRDVEREMVLINKLIKMGVLNQGAVLDDVLGLSIENFLDRRLVTIVFKRGLANSLKHARQLVAHGHVVIGGRKISYPSYLVPKDEEAQIQVKTVQQKPATTETAKVA